MCEQKGRVVEKNSQANEDRRKNIEKKMIKMLKMSNGMNYEHRLKIWILVQIISV